MKEINENNIDIIREIVEKVTQLDISKRTSKAVYVRARSIYYDLCKKHSAMPNVVIGKSVNKDHAAVYHAKANFFRDIMQDSKWRGIFLKCSIASQESFKDFSDVTLKWIKDIENANEEINSLKIDNSIMKQELSMCINVKDGLEMEMIKCFRELSEQEKENALLKIKVMAKVSRKLKEREPIRAVKKVGDRMAEKKSAK